MNTFINKGQQEIQERIQVETFCGMKILRVDGVRVGHALTEEQVEAFGFYLASALPDLEALFTGTSIYSS